MLTIGKTVQHVRRSDEDDDADWSLRIPIPPSPAHYQYNNIIVFVFGWLALTEMDTIKRFKNRYVGLIGSYEKIHG